MGRKAIKTIPFKKLEMYSCTDDREQTLVYQMEKTKAQVKCQRNKIYNQDKTNNAPSTSMSEQKANWIYK